ncbi:MAG: hypothetical protein IT214_02630 [Chitinophagaceae bacterium]|nr:hypothetical protein [Chitinophagaceae bacterium]
MRNSNQNNNERKKGFFINEFFMKKNPGIETTENDFPAIQPEISEAYSASDHDNKDSLKLCEISYRPFDERIVYSGRVLVDGPGKEMARNFTRNDNSGIVFSRLPFSDNCLNVFITKRITDVSFLAANAEAKSFIFPLYDYSGIIKQRDGDWVSSGILNLNMEIVNKIARGLGLQFVREKETGNICFVNNNDDLRDEFKQVFLPADLMDYIYAVLCSPGFVGKYDKPSKNNFPEIHYPQNTEVFWKLVKIGGTMRQLHLLECPAVENFITRYPVCGDNLLNSPVYENGNVYINREQYFSNVPDEVWNFYVGTYQPAQDWLLIRKGKSLSNAEIQKYQKIIVALSETRRLMEIAGNLLF